MFRFFVLCLSVIMYCGLQFSSVWAQGRNIPPRVLVIFDTSGSMLWAYDGSRDCQGDGSETYPHRNMCTSQEGSRMFHAKQALTQVIQNTPGVEFGLMRYGQLEAGDPGFGDRQYSVGAQYQDGNGNVLQSNYDGSSNGCGPADLLVAPSFDSTPSVLEWMDGVENYPNNKELRGNGYTPLTHSLSTAREELITLISQDPEAQCRSYYVLLLTDGYQQCPDQTADDPTTRQLVANELVREADQLRGLNVLGENHNVFTYVVGFGPGTRFASELDELARAGGTAVNHLGEVDVANGSAYQAEDPNGLIQSLSEVLAGAVSRESCDGIDNDCDGAVDEDFGQVGSTCQIGFGTCVQTGQIECNLAGDGVICSATPQDPEPEVCDFADNDCDGRVDENVSNQCGGCGPIREICDGIDNDCDQVADEGVLNECGGCGAIPEEVCDGVDNDCDGREDEGVLNQCGGCGDVPVELCNCEDDDCDQRIDEGFSNCNTTCNCTPVEEICNGLDDDCDQRIDEGVANLCGACGPDLVEVCNGLDEDCDGLIDENFMDEGEMCGFNQGLCQAGEVQCQGGRAVCVGLIEPMQETCDQQDNDCDGAIDEDAVNACNICGYLNPEVCDNIDNDCDGQDDGIEGLCSEGYSCLNGECTQPCMQGECAGGLICVDGQCSTSCRNRDCPSGWVCQNGECQDPCIDIPCGAGTYCSLGRCLPADCYGAGCAPGLICQDRQCVPDPCADVQCGPQQGCFEGRCFDDCDATRCPEGTACRNGQCLDDPCLRLNCTHPFACVDGRCAPDPCFERECDLGFMCERGVCIEDPCLGTTCPPGDTCHRGVCSSSIPNAQPPQQPQDNNNNIMPIATVPPEGCACEQNQSHPWGTLPLWLGLWLPLGLLIRRRRTI